MSAVRRQTGSRSGAPLADGSATSWPSRSGGSTTAALLAHATASSPRCAERCTHRAAQAYLSVVLILTCCKAHVLQPAAQPDACHFCHIRMPTVAKPAVWRCRRQRSCRCSRTASLRCAGCRLTCQRSSCRCCQSECMYDTNLLCATYTDCKLESQGSHNGWSGKLNSCAHYAAK